MMEIPLSNLTLTPRALQYASDALDTGWISGTGSYVSQFEQALAEKLQRKHVIAVANGTLALELALRGLGIGPGDEVIVPALTFVAPAATVRAVGALPVFADITEETWTIDPEDVATLINPRTKAIIAVDVLGHPCDYYALRTIAGDIPIIEDAAEAHGAGWWLGAAPCGCFGKVSTFSFHANKVITTGEGGCVATDDDELAGTLRIRMNHGMTKARPYWHDMVGSNYRMSNLHAAIGLAHVQEWYNLVIQRKEVGWQYAHLLVDTPVQKQPIATGATTTCWLYTVASPVRERILVELRDKGIDARAIWPALPMLPLYRESVRGGYPVACKVSREAFWLPTWTGMPQETIERVADALRAAVGVMERNI